MKLKLIKNATPVTVRRAHWSIRLPSMSVQVFVSLCSMYCTTEWLIVILIAMYVHCNVNIHVVMQCVRCVDIASYTYVLCVLLFVCVGIVQMLCTVTPLVPQQVNRKG